MRNLTTVDVESRKSIDFASGDVIKVWNKIKEANGKIRLQAFEGMVLARKHGTEIGATFTVRKVASGVGVERIYPLFSDNIDNIEIIRHAKTRKSKLYYVRDKAKKDVRRKMKEDTKRSIINKEDVTAVEVEHTAAE